MAYRCAWIWRMAAGRQYHGCGWDAGEWHGSCKAGFMVWVIKTRR